MHEKLVEGFKVKTHTGQQAIIINNKITRRIKQFSDSVLKTKTQNEESGLKGGLRGGVAGHNPGEDANISGWE